MKESKLLEKILDIGRKIIPKNIFRFFQPAYHFILAITSALIYRFPGKKLVIIGVTGTKGKTTTVELVNAILEETGCKTALASTLRYKIGDKEWRNMFKMTLRGRFFTQRFLRQAVEAGCTHAVIEISSEGVPQSRHRFIYPGVLIFTNLAPEHIESHGSYEKYIEAKLTIAKQLEGRHDGVIVVNTDDKEGRKFLELNIKNKVPYSLRDTMSVRADEKGSSFQIGKLVVHSSLPGIFNVYNMLAAISYSKFAGIPDEKIKNALEKVRLIRGRMEKIDCGQKFDVVVDYAHTPDSLRAAYEAYVPNVRARKYHLICILGSTGGGRDRWKRGEMGKIADRYCNQIILTNEDPYDEDQNQIVNDIKKGIKRKPCEIIMDRRAAIYEALKIANEKTETLRHASEENNTLRQAQGTSNQKIAVLITGKGTDPYIMGPNGTKIPWDDAEVAREELQKIIK